MAKSLKELREEARSCQDCPLWANATQTLFGAGDPHARGMLVGERPGAAFSQLLGDLKLIREALGRP